MEIQFYNFPNIHSIELSSVSSSCVSPKTDWYSFLDPDVYPSSRQHFSAIFLISSSDNSVAYLTSSGVGPMKYGFVRFRHIIRSVIFSFCFWSSSPRYLWIYFIYHIFRTPLLSLSVVPDLLLATKEQLRRKAIAHRLFTSLGVHFSWNNL